MKIYVSHVFRRNIPCYVFSEGYKGSRYTRLLSQQQVGKASCESGGFGRSGSDEQVIKQKKDCNDLELHEMPQKRRSISPLNRKSIYPELTCSKGKASFKNRESGRSESAKRVIKRKKDGDDSQLDEMPQKRRSINPLSRESISPELTCSKGKASCESDESGRSRSTDQVMKRKKDGDNLEFDEMPHKRRSIGAENQHIRSLLVQKGMSLVKAVSLADLDLLIES